MYFLHVAVQQSHFSRDTFKLGGFNSQPNVNLVKDSVQTLVSSLLRTALKRIEFGLQPARRPAKQQTLLKFLKRIECFRAPAALSRTPLGRIFRTLQG
ncbi:MAG: hypothetical protein ABL932_21255 [Terricaulis sp.]